MEMQGDGITESNQREEPESNQRQEPVASSPQPPPYSLFDDVQPTASRSNRERSSPDTATGEQLNCRLNYSIAEHCYSPPSYEEAVDGITTVNVNTSSPTFQAAKEHKKLSEVKTPPSSDSGVIPDAEVQGTQHQGGPDLHLASAQQSGPAISALWSSTVAVSVLVLLAALLVSVWSAYGPTVHPTLPHLAKLCDGYYYSVSRLLDGRLLVGRRDFLEIRGTSGELLSIISTEGHVTGACEVLGRVYLLIYKWPGSKREISVRDIKSLEEISSWPLPDIPVYSYHWHSTNLAVLGQTLVVPDPDNSQLLVYSSEGQLLSQHTISCEPWYVSTTGTDIIVSDLRNNKVSVYNASSHDYQLNFTYTGLEKPTAGAVSSDGHLYLGSLSRDNKKLHVVSSTGHLITELHHKHLGDCLGLNIERDKLLAATWGGLHLYQLGR